MKSARNDQVERFLPLRPAVFHLLLSLSQGDRHGYALKLAAEERTGGVLKIGPGTLYESLQRMERQELISETKAPPDHLHERRDRRYYRITALGRSVLRGELRQMEAALAEAKRADLLGPTPQGAR
ncbi:MAG: PadR family transcriptional regulator [Longimicrobiales bacterium]